MISTKSSSCLIKIYNKLIIFKYDLQQFNHVQLSSTKLSSGLRSTKIEEIQLRSTIPKLSKTRPKNLVTKSVDSSKKGKKGGKFAFQSTISRIYGHWQF